MRSVSIFVGSVYGNAQHVAEEVQTMFASKGVESEIFTDPETSDFSEAESIVVITSSTGQGDVPPNLELFHSDLRDEFPLMNGKPFAVAALGDSSYGDSFCGAGRQFQELLEELQGMPVASMLEVDAIETLAAEEEIVPWLAGLVDPLTEA